MINILENVKKGINSNTLKMIAILSMIIDHFGYYFSFCLNYDEYIMFRIIGRIAMPIFVFLLVQGYQKTSDFKKYSFRILFYAFITQLVLIVVNLINIIYIPEYTANVTKELNILFSMSFSLIILYLIDTKNKIIKNIENKKIIATLDIILKGIIVLSILFVYHFVKFDYGYILPAMVICIYLLDRIKNIFEEKVNKKNNIYIKMIYFFFLSIIIASCCIFENNYGIYSVLSLIFLILYNGKLGKKSKNLQNLYYIVFPFQHAFLYLLALTIYVSN